MDATSEFRPPYMSFQTFWNYVEELADKPLPPRIDRSIMKTKSGTDQANLTMAFTSFGFTDAEGNVQPALVHLVERTPKEDRLTAFGNLMQGFYTGPLTVSAKNGTPADLNKAFTDDYPSIQSADTRRKAVTFFLHAARKSGIELSPHFPATRGGQGAPGTPRPAKRTSPRRRKDPGSDGTGATGAEGSNSNRQQGDHYTVDLTSGGQVTVSVTVNLFDLTTDDRTFVIDLVDKLKGYPSAAQPQKQEEAHSS
jgi:hypothetical protein